MKKKYNRRKRIIIAYTLRTIVFLGLVVMISLMVCGGIYIYELFHGGNKKQFVNTYTYKSESDNKLYGNMQDKEADYLSEKGKENNNTYKGIRIVLDAGHGGKDGGTSSGDVVEKDITLAVVGHMQKLLEEQGIEVVLTRDSDDFISLEERSAIENQADADLFVSIHCNFYEDDSSIHGLECYYYEGSKEGQDLAEEMIDKLKERDNITVRSAKEDSFYVLKNTKSPAVLIELGYLSNRNECRELASDEYQEKLAEELAESLEEIISSRLFLLKMKLTKHKLLYNKS